MKIVFQLLLFRWPAMLLTRSKRLVEMVCGLLIFLWTTKWSRSHVKMIFGLLFYHWPTKLLKWCRTHVKIVFGLLIFFACMYVFLGVRDVNRKTLTKDELSVIQGACRGKLIRKPPNMLIFQKLDIYESQALLVQEKLHW